jgi:NAD(P)-dependent dehydrogenase (short-subunit alcohol dehydrogenase family)
MASFDGKVAWITGASSGIGRALALQLVRDGATVALSARREQRLQQVLAEVERAGGRGIVLPCDVTDDAAVRGAVEALVSNTGRLDVAVANAGFTVRGRIEELDSDAWRRQFETNVFGVARTARAAIPLLRQTGGRLVLMGSVSAFLCTPQHGAYSASKAAVRAMGACLAEELRGSGVSCTTVHPGFVDSEIGSIDNEGRFDSTLRDDRPRGLMWSSEDAASAIVRAALRRERECVFTRHARAAAWFSRHMPPVARLAVRWMNSGHDGPGHD